MGDARCPNYTTNKCVNYVNLNLKNNILFKCVYVCNLFDIKNVYFQIHFFMERNL